MDDLHDPALVAAIARFVTAYREAGGVAAQMLEAVLANFPAATASDYACALPIANRAARERRDRLGGDR